MKSKTSLKSRALFWLLTNVQSFTQFLESWSSQRLGEYIRQLIFAFDVGDVNLLLFLRLPHKEETHVNVPCSLMGNTGSRMRAMAPWLSHLSGMAEVGAPNSE